MWQCDTGGGEGEVPGATPGPEAQGTLMRGMRVTWRSSPVRGAPWCEGTSWAQRGPCPPAVSFQ